MENQKNLDFNLNDFNEIKNKIIFRIGSDYNKKKTENIVYRSSMNVYIYYYVIMQHDNKCIKSYPITWDMINKWNVLEPDIYNLAKKNTPNIFPFDILKIKDLLETLMDKEDDNYDKNANDNYDPPFFVLTNKNKVYGATGILYPGVTKLLYKKFNCDYYILPSSVHEVILVPSSYGESEESLLKMIHDVNSTEIEDDEFLSNNLYKYESKAELIKIA